MNAETRTGLAAAARACAEADIAGLAATLQRMADDPVTTEQQTLDWLFAASIACNAVASERAMRGLDHRLACAAFAVCHAEHAAAVRRMP
jgi:hypothetical protein